jgi:hypothetical protein
LIIRFIVRLGTAHYRSAYGGMYGPDALVGMADVGQGLSRMVIEDLFAKFVKLKKNTVIEKKITSSVCTWRRHDKIRHQA